MLVSEFPRLGSIGTTAGATSGSYQIWVGREDLGSKSSPNPRTVSFPGVKLELCYWSPTVRKVLATGTSDASGSVTLAWNTTTNVPPTHITIIPPGKNLATSSQIAIPAWSRYGVPTYWTGMSPNSSFPLIQMSDTTWRIPRMACPPCTTAAAQPAYIYAPEVKPGAEVSPQQYQTWPGVSTTGVGPVTTPGGPGPGGSITPISHMFPTGGGGGGEEGVFLGLSPTMLAIIGGSALVAIGGVIFLLKRKRSR